MASPAALALDGPVDWLKLLLGLGIYFLPGIALADRLLPRDPRRFIMAPMLAVTVMVLLAIAGDTVASLPVTRGITMVLALASAAWIGRRRLATWYQQLRSSSPSLPVAKRPPQAALLRAMALLLMMWFVGSVHYLPHTTGEGSESPVTAYFDMLDRDPFPAPVHVDEHIHMAFIGQILREERVEITAPYTDKAQSTSLFSVQGLRTERGFDVAVAQTHLLTDAPLPTLARFIPSIWAAYTALVLWFALRPAPGAMASAAMVAVLPTTVRFLGPGFLVPITFALPWILLTLIIGLRAKGATRFGGTLLVVTAAHFLHLVAGVLCIAVSLLCIWLRPDAEKKDRIPMVVATLLPLLWIIPAAARDIQAAILGEHRLPFSTDVFAIAGFFVYAFTAAGVIVAFARGTPATAPHRVLAVLAIPMVVSMYLSVVFDHHNEATYTRQVPMLFIIVATLAGLAIGWGAEQVAIRTRSMQKHAGYWRIGISFLVVAVALAPVVQAQLNTPYYRVYTDADWQRVEAAAATLPEDAVYLTDPWEAPVINALTGATPHAVLYPGNPPVNGHDHTAYLRGITDPAWFHARGITHVVSPVAPSVPHDRLGTGVYRIDA